MWLGTPSRTTVQTRDMSNYGSTSLWRAACANQTTIWLPSYPTKMNLIPNISPLPQYNFLNYPPPPGLLPPITIHHGVVHHHWEVHQFTSLISSSPRLNYTIHRRSNASSSSNRRYMTRSARSMGPCGRLIPSGQGGSHHNNGLK